ncbi:hypothetical protein DFJ67_3030 [Asanoa ferruginea]|uniref:Uncharacterized protein n=1 Tax=Asanoa ferruginea TaxID=53367 RepID=A0A3D9ZIC4_9ACTN|nr:hypothetical protein [Asanoa ferruginea]REF97035.1 hypothetical protein DFJ67_3030 [Asanoa ferruginea]GIF50533.1 hypothetical protein Afe04nite_50720 [Asanoa ferruginea]
MLHRRPGSVASYLLWALVALGDLAIVVINAGLTLVIALAGCGVVAAGTAMLRRLRQRVPAPVAVPLERDA